jgi:molybdenum cofactor guanylyltransferase
MTATPPLWDSVQAWILAGGRSSRMGADKALLRVHGTTLLDAALAAVSRCGAVVVVGPDRDTLAARDEHPEHGEEADTPPAVVVREDPPHSGPVEGLRAAAAATGRAVSPTWTLLLPCDLPHPDEVVERLLVAIDAHPQAEAVARRRGGRMQWPTGVYRTDRLLSALTSDAVSLGRVLGGLEPVAVDDDDRTLDDLDTPEDVLAHERLCSRGAADTAPTHRIPTRPLSSRGGPR